MSSQALVRKQTTEVDPLIVHIRAQALHWTEQLSVADTRQDLEGVVFRLLNDVRFFKELIDQVDQDVPALSPDFAKEIHRFMATNLHQGLTLERLAKFLGYSEKYSSELFQIHMGQPFSQYLKQLRLSEARRLLEMDDLPLTQIAQRLGFSDQFAFSHFFKRTLGYSPKQFRKGIQPTLRV